MIEKRVAKWCEVKLEEIQLKLCQEIEIDGDKETVTFYYRC
jgi:hypothetical protein